MKKVVLFMAMVALMTSVAHAELIGSWAKTTTGAYDRWVLTVTPTAGEFMTGFDVSVTDPNYLCTLLGGDDVGVFSNNGVDLKTRTSGSLLYPAKDTNTDFLVWKKHSTTTDALIVNEGVDSTQLYAAFARSGGTGALYPTGWSSALELLEVIVPAGTYSGETTPGLTVAGSLNATGDGWNPTPMASCSNVTGGKAAIKIVPEPSTIALLVSGLFGLLAYAWRKRK
jgi:hypothetical protein